MMLLPPDPKQKAVDAWSIAHVGIGALYKVMRVKRPIAYGLLIGYEIIEDKIKPVMFPKEAHVDATENKVMDVVFGILGYEIVPK